MEFLHNVILDLILAVSRAGQEDRTGCGLRPLYAFRVVVRHFGGQSGLGPGLLKCVEQPAGS